MLRLRVHIVVVREFRGRIGLDRRDVESMAKYDQRQSIVSYCDTQILELVWGKVCIAGHSHHLCPNAPSHITMHVN
mgnify:CR=1 FL=1